MTNFGDVKAKLEKHGQEHLLQFWEELSEEQRQQLISDINEINLEEVNEFFKRATASLEESNEKLDDRLQAVPDSEYMSISRTEKEHLKGYEQEGNGKKFFENFL